MKIKLGISKEILILSYLFIFLFKGLYAQNEKIPTPKWQGFYFGISLAPSQGLIQNEKPSSVPGVVSNQMFSFLGTAEIGYSFIKYFGVSTGIGYNTLKTLVTLDSYKDFRDVLDSENEKFQLQVTGSNITEEQTVGSICVPINLNVHLPLVNAVEFLLQYGINLNFPITKKYMSIGTFTYKGFYPQYNVLLEKLPNFKFEEYHPNFVEGNLEISPMFIGSSLSGGLEFNLKDNLRLAVTACYRRTLTNISAYQPLKNNFQISTEPDKANSFMSESSNISAHSIGIMFTLQYLFRK